MGGKWTAENVIGQTVRGHRKNKKERRAQKDKEGKLSVFCELNMPSTYPEQQVLEL